MNHLQQIMQLLANKPFHITIHSELHRDESILYIVRVKSSINENAHPNAYRSGHNLDEVFEDILSDVKKLKE